MAKTKKKPAKKRAVKKDESQTALAMVEKVIGGKLASAKATKR